MGQVYGVILHGTRSGVVQFSQLRGDGSEGRRTLSYIQTAGTTSYNWLIDYDGLIWEVAGWNLQAWHAGHRTPSLHMNTNWYGVAFAQVNTWEPITDQQHQSARWLLAEINKRVAVPLVKLEQVVSRYAAKGVTEHRLCVQGSSQGKSDVGDPALNWSLLF